VSGYVAAKSDTNKI